MGIIYVNGDKVEKDDVFHLGYIDKDKKNAYDDLEMILCKPDGTEVCVLKEAFDIGFTLNFKGIDELQFTMPYYITKQHKRVKNKHWELIKDDYLIKVNNKKIFVINEIKKNNNEAIKDKYIHAYSREYKLSKRKLGILRGTRQLYKDIKDGTITKMQYSFDNVKWNNYTEPFTTEEGKNIHMRIYDNYNAIVAQYVWNSKDVISKTEGILVTYEMIDQINFKIKVTMKIIAETGEGILNILEDETSWKVGYIDKKVREDFSLGQDHRKYRTFDVVDRSWIDVIYDDIQKTFECVVIFDTIKKLINVYHIDTITKNRGLFISEKNYLKSIEENLNDDEVVTRMMIYGKDNLNIARVNPTGQLYIEDYSYYMNTKYMPQSLIDNIKKYDNKVETNTPTFLNLLKDLEKLRNEEIELQNQLVDLTVELNIAQDNIDIEIHKNQKNSDKPIVVTGTGSNRINVRDELRVNVSDVDKAKDLTSLNTIRDEIKNKIRLIEEKIDNNKKYIEKKIDEIGKIKIALDKKNNFAKNELELLDHFIKQDTWNNANYTDEFELLSAGKAALEKLSKPTLTFSINVVDFLNIVQCQRAWDKIQLGDIITISYKEFDIDLEARLVKIVHNIDKNMLDLTISNLEELDDPAKFLSDLIKDSAGANNTLNIFKHEWDLSAGNQDLISKIINSSLDSAKNAVLSGRLQNISITERGISLKHMDNEDRQIRMLNNIIALTKDNWKSCSTAITADGVVAEQLYGKVVGSNKLIITNMNSSGESSFLVDEDHMKAINMDLSLENKNSTNRIYMNPEIGFKIQRRKGSGWEDLMYTDMEGNIYAKSFNIINTNTRLDDTGLQIDNGAIWIRNSNGQVVFNANQNGEVDASGRFRVLKDAALGNKDGNILCDMYKDNSKGGKLLINDWNGKNNVFLGSSPNAQYNGGFLKLYNNQGEERAELGVFTGDDAGTLNLKGKDKVSRAILSAKHGKGDFGVLKLTNEKGENRMLITAQSDHDNVASSNRRVGGQVELTSFDGSTKGWLTVNEENAFGIYNEVGAVELNKRTNTVRLAGKSFKRYMALGSSAIIISYDSNANGDPVNANIKIENGKILLKANDNNYIEVSSSGIRLKGSKIDLN